VIYIIKGESMDADGGYVFLLPIGKDTEDAIRRLRPLPPLGGPAFKLLKVDFRCEPELGGRYVSNDDQDAVDALARQIGIDAAQLTEDLDEAGMILAEANLDLAAAATDGDVIFRSLAVHPDGRIELAGTIDDEHVPGYGWHGTSVFTNPFTLKDPQP
jgi:hypothetical protein